MKKYSLLPSPVICAIHTVWQRLRDAQPKNALYVIICRPAGMVLRQPYYLGKNFAHQFVRDSLKKAWLGS